MVNELKEETDHRIMLNYQNPIIHISNSQMFRCTVRELIDTRYLRRDVDRQDQQRIEIACDFQSNGLNME